ncbi:MAG TPA: ATP-binding protein [Verrucomicrobiota bacterium]|nr:PAS domain-containing sensor histidine kinase [Verrucomicrobiales bacterium]HRI11685.1 ATP-binding protein [Verrucomicrobiota bacterium]
MAVNRSTRPKSGFIDKVLHRLSRLDAQELHSLVERLKQERALLESLFQTIEDGVVVADRDDRVIYLNQAAGRLLGVAPEGALGQPMGRLLPELGENVLRSSERQKVVRREIEVRFPRPRFLRVFSAPIEQDPGAGIALVLHDATETHHRTQEFIEAERLHALTLLASSVAHEIGNPLNAIHIHLQLMEREVRKLQQIAAGASSADPAVITDKLASYLSVAQGEIARLDYIISDFLKAMRPTPPKLKDGSVNEVIRDTLDLLRPELENRRLRIVEKLAPEVPVVRLDAAQLKQALVNLVKNAFQAMTTGGTLTLASGSTAESVWITVGDTGCGIPPEQLSRLFQPFQTTKEQGSGLGLMVVQRIIRDHGGRIDFESAVSRGTTFKIWLPRPDRPPRMLPQAA